MLSVGPHRVSSGEAEELERPHGVTSPAQYFTLSFGDGHESGISAGIVKGI
jgi:hypothetical protein